ncbi:4-hydroxyproline epimerase [Amphibiibacter pelophylacis]|uniref:4-hydroxyproline epimerase n=1 Tax=Amphibiibacter pelophylacis TaxID=1799477 RepID=A0ACC6P546_9BURK
MSARTDIPVFDCIDGHTCGNPVRLVVSGHPPLQGVTQSERRQHFMAEFDAIRTGLMYEPRGHAQMSGAFLYPSTRPDCDVAVLYIETSGCLPMCGHGTIGVVTFAIERGLVTPQTPGLMRLDTPAGRVDAHYTLAPGSTPLAPRVAHVRLINVPSFLYAQDVAVQVPGLGELVVDIAYGGNFYPIVETQAAFRDMADFTPGQLVTLGRALRDAVNEQITCIHPLDDSIRGVRHVQWTGAPRQPGSHGRNAVLYGHSALDRSPCGTGTSARLAQRWARGLLQPGDEYVHESIIGSQFVGRIEALTQVGALPAIVPSIQGWAVITGTSRITLDPRDPFVHGFELG